MQSGWRQLRSTSTATAVGPPPLLIKYEFGLSDCTVWLTDLTLLWTESLDRKSMIRRSLDIGTSIDASEGSDQRHLLLQKVVDALEQRTGTATDLVQNDNSDRRVILRTRTTLPIPLEPLEWFFVLAPAPQSLMTTEFTIPLIRLNAATVLQRTSLLQQVRDKDHVIAKFIDTLQSEGVELSRAFPGAPSSKPGHRADARHAIGRSVKGLGEFDEEQWQSLLAKNAGCRKGIGDLVSDIFSVESSVQPELKEFQDYTDWWDRLSHKNAQPNGAASKHADIHTENQVSSQGDFQRQPTPTKFQSRSPNPPIRGAAIDPKAEPVSNLPEESPARNDSTTDESDHNTEPQDEDTHLAKATPLTHTNLVTSRRNALVSPDKDVTSFGGKQMGSIGEEAAQSQKSKTDGHDTAVHVFRDRMLSDTEDITSPKKVTTNTSSESRSIPKSKPKLGKIGGKAKSNIQREVQSSTFESEPTKLERLQDGNQQEADTIERKRPTAQNGRPTSSTEYSKTPSPPRATSEERANRKREQLKRELESKSQKAVKKKRKF